MEENTEYYDTRSIDEMYESIEDSIADETRMFSVYQTNRDRVNNNKQ